MNERIRKILNNVVTILFLNGMKRFTIQKKKGKEYVCIEDRGRIEGKVKRTYFKYLGPRDQFPDLPIGKPAVITSTITKDSFETIPFEFGISAALWAIA